MNGARGENWQLSVDMPSCALVALYVRDATGLTYDGKLALPPLEPAVPRVALDPRDQAAASREWAEAWQEMLNAGMRDPMGRLEQPSANRPLPRLVETVLPAARAWSARRRGEHAERSVNGSHCEAQAVRDFGRRLYRPIRPFQLRITELPVASATGWRLNDQHSLVSTRLRCDQPAYLHWLNMLLAEIA